MKRFDHDRLETAQKYVSLPLLGYHLALKAFIAIAIGSQPSVGVSESK